MKKILLIFVILVSQNLFSQKVKVIAHRGASSLAPENTISSFTKAIDIGSDYIELDVWDSSDDSLMIIHDNTIDRTTNGTGNVRSMTYSQLRRWDAGSWFSSEFAGEKIPTLFEVLKLIKERNSVACVEMKNSQITSKVLELVQRMNLIDKIYFFCFQFDALKEISLKDSTAKLVYLVGNVDSASILKLKTINGKVIASGGGNSQELINFAHKEGFQFWPWTIDDTLKMKEYLQKGVDGIITNYPQSLIKITSKVKIKSNMIPNNFNLKNYPNPFNNQTVVSFQLPIKSKVSMKVFDELGNEIETILNETKNEGTHKIIYSASELPSGVYFMNLQSQLFSSSIKTLLIK